MRLRLLVLISLLSGVLMPAYSAMEKDSLHVPFKDRIGIHTNTVDWLLLTPNLGLECSFIQNKYQKVSALLFGKYNPNSSTTINPAYVYNIGGARLEVRWYYRTRRVSEGEVKLDSLERAKYGKFRAFWKKLATRPYSLLARENPRDHRAFYLGPYVAFDKYTIKLSDTGYQGYSIGLGATFGYSFPLYQYKNGTAIDFELGVSAGLAMSCNDMFGYNSDADCYYYAGSKKFHVVPFPVIADAHVGFVYRINSIRDQITGIRQDKLEGYAAIYELYNSYDEKIANYKYPSHVEKTKDGRDSVVVHGEYLPSDSILAWNSVVEEKNKKIRAINKRVLESGVEVDSAMMLEELRLCYEYVEVPEKLFSQYDRMLPNKEIASISELNDPYINGLLEKYAAVEADNGEFDKQLVNSYVTLRNRLLEKNDSTSEIRLVELMVLAISNINGNSIKTFNDKYHNPAYVGKIEYDEVSLKMQVITGTGTGRVLDFVFGLDTLALVVPQSYSFRGMNAEIEAQNVYKQVLLEEKLGMSLSSDGEKSENAAKKNKSKKNKEKKQKAKKDKKTDGTATGKDVAKESQVADVIENQADTGVDEDKTETGGVNENKEEITTD